MKDSVTTLTLFKVTAYARGREASLVILGGRLQFLFEAFH